jgi:hypothetical protein
MPTIAKKRFLGIASAVALALGAMSCSDRVINSPIASLGTPTQASRISAPVGALNWLAPLGTGVADPATFDASAITEVDVCVWTGSACSGTPVAQFATVPTTGQGTLGINTVAGRYEATWSLLSTSFITRKTYRIRALQGATEIGAVLVDVVRGRWALTRTDGTLAPLVAANTLPIQLHAASVPLVPVAINEIESNGGTPGDWVELYNKGTSTVDLSGYVFKDDNDTHIYTIPSGTTIAAGGYLVLDEANFVFGLGAPDAARLFTPWGVVVDSYSWTSHAATTYGRCPNATGAFVTMASSTKGAANDCTTPNSVKINEVESSGGTPGDWIELYNTGTSAIDISGFVLKDDNDAHVFTIPAGTSIGAGAYLAFDVEVSFGLGAPDAARLFDKAGALLDSYTWTTHATTTYGRCPNGTGAFGTTGSSTKGAANVCASTGPASEAWPGSNNVTTADGLNVFGGNLSGLIYEAGTGGSPDVLWGARNGPGSIFRLIFNGSIWTPDPSNGWGAGKGLLYTNGTGEPDSEDLTFTTGSAAGMYVATERNNSNSGVSRPAVLRYDVTGSGTSLTATNEWNLTSDLPAVAANSGLEGITWVPDSALVAQGFFDVAAGHLYNPADYANHGGGLFFVGLEGNGVIYVYALDHASNAFHRITSISTGFPSGVMALQYDRELGQLWATCDDTCGGLSDIFVIDQTPASPTLGRLTLTHIFARASTMPNINNEGFGFAPQSRCVAGLKPAFWSDDSETGGHAIRQASIPCVKFP